MTQLPSLMDMLKAGMHFGHQKSRWHPKMKPYIFGVRNGVHIMDLEKTQVELQKAMDYAKGLATAGKNVLFVGTKKQAQSIVKAAAESCGMPFLTERWIGGLLTNFDETKQRIKKYKNLKAQIASNEIEKYTKKEQLDIKKSVEKMDRYLAGLTNLEKMPDAIYIVDMRVCKTAVTEGLRTNVPIIGVCDTNVNPDQATYVIPANDDAVNSIKTISLLLADAINEGKVEYEKNKVVFEKERSLAKPVVKTQTSSETNQAGKSSTVKAAAVKPGVKKERRALTKESSI